MNSDCDTLLQLPRSTEGEERRPCSLRIPTGRNHMVVSSDFWMVISTLYNYTRSIGDGLRNFKSRSSDEDDT
ncbi:hypothetical protein TNCV_4446381 [Trichonephila clavipes]|nr:hypothetical protein TNCV_4446381 [Trichonephila clavipes]